jgi:hypothetical protein
MLGCSAYEAARASVAADRNSPAAKPLPADGSTALAEKDEALQYAWFERNFIQAYRKVGHRSPKWNPAAEAFLRESAPSFLGLAPGGTPDLRARAKTILDAGCDDPVVLYFAARTLAANEKQSREASELFERAVAGMHDAAYPRGVARFVASGLRRDYDQREEGTGKRATLDPVELRWFKESLTDGSYAPDEDVVFAKHLLFGSGNWLYSRNLAAVGSAIESTAWIDPWVRLLLAGERKIDEAWNARGKDYASKVKAEEWKGMQESLASARKALSESWRLRPDRPEAATAMIGVAMTDGGRGDTPRLWFDRAVAARFDYGPAYGKLVNALRWRWSGDPGALLAFARECADTRRFDTEVPLQAYWAVEQIESDALEEARHQGEFDDPEQARQAAAAAVLPPSPYKKDDVYELISTVLMRYRRNPGTVRWQRYAAYQVEVDYKAARYEAAAKVLDEISGVLEPDVREKVGGPLPEARIYALASPLGSDVTRAEDLYRAGKLEEALVLLAKARAAAPPRALPYFDQRMAAGQIEADLAAGRPATPFSTRTLDGWTPANGTWKVESDGALIVTSDAKGHLIAGDAHVGSDIEISADIEIASTSNGQFQAGILLGRNISISTSDWLSFRIKKTAHEGEVVYFSQNFYRPPRSISRPVALKSHVVVQSWNGHLWAYVDGKPAVTDYVPEWRMARGGDAQVGFGGYVDDNTIVVRYRNVRLRRLSATPAPPDGPSAAASRDGGGTALASRFQGSDESALVAEMNDAIEQVKRIVNTPVPALPRTADAKVEVFGPGWFHEGATKPSFLSVDVSATQQFPYDQFEYVTSDMNPGLMFRAHDLEFNAMTKYFYTDRSMPKKRLGHSEMAEINRLYRIIGAREQDLARLRAGAPSSAGTAGSAVQHQATAAYVAAAALLVILAITAYRRRDSRRR